MLQLEKQASLVSVFKMDPSKDPSTNKKIIEEMINQLLPEFLLPPPLRKFKKLSPRPRILIKKFPFHLPAF